MGDKMGGETIGGVITIVEETIVYAKLSNLCKRLFGLLHLIVLQICSFCCCFKVFRQLLEEKVSK